MKLKGLLSQWLLPEELPFLSLSEEIPLPIQRALFRRNLRTLKEIQDYFHPDPNGLLPIEQLPDVERALSLLHESIMRGHFIFVVGDYDVDGTVSAALLGSFFRAVGHTGFYLHLPDRFGEGYGVSDYAVEQALSMGSSLFIAVDCGTKDAPRLQRLKEAGVRVIVLDHHAIGEGEKMPNVDAFVNPQRLDSSYPNRYLSAGALTYKLLKAYQERYGQPESWEGIDLAAISILSDIMPLVGENRLIVHLGLELMRRAPRPGILALSDAMGMSPESLSRSRPVVFQLVPRLNVAGRLKNPKYALHLLLAQKETQEVAEIARYLHQLNAYRQNLQKIAYQEALQYLERKHPGISANKAWAPPALVAVVSKVKYGKGIIGLVAADLTEGFYRPAVVFTEVDGELIGSARSPAEVPLYEVLSRCCGKYMKRFGGHERAAGLTILPKDLDNFREAFEEGCAAYGEITPTGVIDAAISVEDLRKFNLAEWVEKFEPIGPQNEAPRFLIRDLHFLEESNGKFLFGTRDALYQATVEQGQLAPFRNFFREHIRKPVSLIVTPRLSERRNTYLRLRDAILSNPNP